MRLVYMINRRDIEHILAGDTLVVPEQVGDPLDFAPFPRVVPGAEGESKLILVSLRVQALGAYEAGRLVYWAPASTGRREKPTPPGRYHVNWTSRERISSVNGEWLLRWVVNIHNTSGISTHQYALPGYPASHSCVRLMEEDARWVHDWVDMWVVNSDETEVVKPGTPLIVFGEWIWDARDPWRNLPDDRGACTISAEEINAALALPPPPEDAFEIDPLPEDAGQ
jgi:hypothetical protein